MKTIEERAANLYPANYSDPVSCSMDMMSRERYIKGTTEQREIDIEKACEFWFTRLQDFLGEGLTKGCVEEFRKAMVE